MKKTMLKAFANFAEKVAVMSSESTSLAHCYQPEEPESVRKAAEARRQAKLAKRAEKKSK